MNNQQLLHEEIYVYIKKVIYKLHLQLQKRARITLLDFWAPPSAGHSSLPKGHHLACATSVDQGTWVEGLDLRDSCEARQLITKRKITI